MLPHCNLPLSDWGAKSDAVANVAWRVGSKIAQISITLGLVFFAFFFFYYCTKFSVQNRQIGVLDRIFLSHWQYCLKNHYTCIRALFFLKNRKSWQYFPKLERTFVNHLRWHDLFWQVFYGKERGGGGGGCAAHSSLTYAGRMIEINHAALVPHPCFPAQLEPPPPYGEGGLQMPRVICFPKKKKLVPKGKGRTDFFHQLIFAYICTVRAKKGTRFTCQIFLFSGA